MIDDRHITADQLVLQDATVREVDPIPLICDDNDRTPQRDSLAEPDISRNLRITFSKKKPSFFSSTHRQMVQFQDIRNALETFLEVSNLLKGVTQFDDWSLVEQSVRVHDEFAMFEGVQVGGDE